MSKRLLIKMSFEKTDSFYNLPPKEEILIGGPKKEGNLGAMKECVISEIMKHLDDKEIASFFVTIE
ncbi:hypothetical protein ACFL1Y_00370 [Patescibacteria group bacterium]